MDVFERLENGEDCFEILKEEILKIQDIKETAMVSDFVFDKEIGKMLVKYSNPYDQIKRSKCEKQIIELEKIKSKVFKFNISKVRSYNEMFDEKNKKHKETYFEYKEEIKNLFNENNKDGSLDYFLNNKYILLSIDFHINYIQKDIDNILKPFIDFLYMNVETSDNNIKKINTTKYKNNENNNEFILFSIIILNKADVDRSSLLEEFNKQ